MINSFDRLTGGGGGHYGWIGGKTTASLSLCQKELKVPSDLFTLRNSISMAPLCLSASYSSASLGKLNCNKIKKQPNKLKLHEATFEKYMQKKHQYSILWNQKQ